MCRALLLAIAIMSASASADPATLGSIPRTNTVYTAREVDVLLENAGGGADPALASNLVATVVAEAGESAAATETWRIVLADHQRRLDALEDADGTDPLTEAQAEQLIEDRMDTLLYTIETEWGDFSGCIPIQSTQTESTTISSSASGVAAELSPLRATRYYASTTNNRTLGFSSFSGVGNNPCILILERFSSVSWPSGALVETAYAYNNGTPNVYAVYKLNGTIFCKKIYP